VLLAFREGCVFARSQTGKCAARAGCARARPWIDYAGPQREIDRRWLLQDARLVLGSRIRASHSHPREPRRSQYESQLSSRLHESSERWRPETERSQNDERPPMRSVTYAY